MTKTAINRALIGACLFTIGAQLTLNLGGALLGLPPHTVQVLYPLMWSCTSGIVVMSVDRRLAVASVGYLVAFLVASARPAWIFYAMSASNLLLTVRMAKAWGAKEVARGFVERHLGDVRFKR
jgi:hypothetical protein